MEHDEEGFPELATLPLQRVCAMKDCRKDARPGGKGGRLLCRAHHAEAMRRWRARRARRPSTSCPSSTVPSARPEAVRARVALHRKRKRGEVQLLPCAICTDRSAVVATHPDPAKIGEIVWACRKCRHELVRGARERRERELDEITRRREQEATARRLEAVLAEIERLPEEVIAVLREAASQGGRLGRLAPASPLCQQRLVAAYRRWLETGGSNVQRDLAATDL